MLDLRTIRENADLVKRNSAERRASVDIDHLLSLADQRSAAATKLQDIQRQQNEVAAQVGKAKDAATRAPPGRTG